MKASWSEFAKGYWVTDPPTEDGMYPVCDREGLNAGFVWVWSYRGETFYDGQREPKALWYWSIPLPDLPKPPEWPEWEPEVEEELLAQQVRQVMQTAQCDMFGCKNEPVDCLGGEFYFCEEHRDDAPDAYEEWQKAEEVINIVAKAEGIDPAALGAALRGETSA